MAQKENLARQEIKQVSVGRQKVNFISREEAENAQEIGILIEDRQKQYIGLVA